MRLLLVGYGRMGKLVEKLAPDYGFEVVGRLDDTNNIGGVGIPTAPDADVAVETMFRELIADRFPDHTILAEEFAQDAATRRSSPSGCPPGLSPATCASG